MVGPRKSRHRSLGVLHQYHVTRLRAARERHSPSVRRPGKVKDQASLKVGQWPRCAPTERLAPDVRHALAGIHIGQIAPVAAPVDVAVDAGRRAARDLKILSRLATWKGTTTNFSLPGSDSLLNAIHLPSGETSGNSEG